MPSRVLAVALLSVVYLLCLAQPPASSSLSLDAAANTSNTSNLGLNGPQLFATFYNSRPSLDIRPTVDAQFYFDFIFDSISEVDSNAKNVPNRSYSLNDNSLVYQTTRKDTRVNETQETIATLSVQLNNNATLEFDIWLAYYEGNSTATIQFPNVSVLLASCLPALVVRFQISNWTFASPKNSLQMTASVKVNIGPLEIGTGDFQQFQVLSVPYYNGLYLNAYVPSMVILDNAPNWTAVDRQFQVTQASQPVGANILVSVPYFASSMSFTAFLELANGSQGISATSLITVIGIIIGVFIVAGVAIFLLIRYGGPKKDPKRDVSGEAPSDLLATDNGNQNIVNENAPLLINS